MDVESLAEAFVNFSDATTALVSKLMGGPHQKMSKIESDKLTKGEVTHL